MEVGYYIKIHIFINSNKLLQNKIFLMLFEKSHKNPEIKVALFLRIFPWSKIFNNFFFLRE